MSGRILTLQRQARELGRLRTGYTDFSGQKPRPVRSKTWIITSHAEHYVRAAADEWGGDVEKWQPAGNGAEQWRVITRVDALDSILPSGDPLSQSYEMWSRGGCARRCDGMTEQLSNQPCLCRAQHGDEWWTLPKGDVCAATTRLNVVLPQMPDVGVWRMETHSHYAANEVAAHVDLIRSATRGETAVPIRLRIEQRTRVAQGKTKQFPVIAVELRGLTAGQVMAGQLLGGTGETLAVGAPREQRPAVEAGSSSRPASPAAQRREEPAGEQRSARSAARAAQPAAPREPDGVLDVDSVRAALESVASIDDLNALAAEARAAGLTSVMARRARELSQGSGPRKGAPAPAAPVVEEDPDTLWVQIVNAIPEDWTSEQLERDFTAFAETPAEQASAADMRRYLAALPERARAAS